MEQSLEIFDRLVRELLADEAQNPVAEHISSANLSKTLFSRRRARRRMLFSISFLAAGKNAPF